MSPRILVVGLVVTLVAVTGCSKTSSGPCTDDRGCAAPANKCCNGTCVDLLTSALHCGACATACGAQNAAARCSAGVCGLTCSSGFGDCNAINKDGCETPLATSTSHCGMCGHLCSSTNATSVCDRSLCERSSCNSGYGDCNQDAADGCEVDLQVSLLHCGKCGHACEILNGAPDCANGNCSVASCNASFGDCDQDAVTGCEVDLASSDANCSACGMACPTGQHCRLSKCVAPELVFYGGLINILSTTPTPTGQVSAFNIDTRSWSSIPAGNPDAGTAPAPRFGHVAVWDSTAQQMVVWGGYLANNAPADDDVWALDYAGTAPTWKKLTVSGGPPPIRGLMGSAWDKTSRTLTIFGGGDPGSTTTARSDLWQLDLAALKWTERTDPDGPSPRVFASMVWDSVGQRALVGLGADVSSVPQPGFWAFDPSSTDGGAWSVLTATNAPSPRSSASFLGAAQPLQLWGGVDDMLNPYFDLFTLGSLDPDAGEAWTASQPLNPPDGRGYNLATSAGDRRLIFGGFAYSSTGIVQFNDVWELDADAGWNRIADGGVPRVHPGMALGSVIARE